MAMEPLAAFSVAGECPQPGYPSANAMKAGGKAIWGTYGKAQLY
ncbi:MULTISPECIES: hypothetical protein [Geobacillus]|uniref:Uncharacterized protein n=1 Tax=Geobacillus thermodenitrificans TaxID=33940 RepID=A0ABY9QDL2_GEOTD|nr:MULTISPECIES: hypothetical protein [Geobacillus]MED3717715.1 hypothetical protein [Geobacillus thermodenitrificans]MED3906485.1 hypothetical protein [Geobacillus thermodenitrificans]WMV76341.1 hypothetical protein HSX42_00320 [Geobacillus thermodenitrificans]